MTLQQRLRELREIAGFGLREAARKLGVSPGYLSRIEGRGEVPTPELLFRLADLYGCNFEELLELAKQAQLKAVEKHIDSKHSEALRLFRRSKKKNDKESF